MYTCVRIYTYIYMYIYTHTLRKKIFWLTQLYWVITQILGYYPIILGKNSEFWRTSSCLPNYIG